MRVGNARARSSTPAPECTDSTHLLERYPLGGCLNRSGIHKAGGQPGALRSGCGHNIHRKLAIHAAVYVYISVGHSHQYTTGERKQTNTEIGNMVRSSNHSRSPPLVLYFQLHYKFQLQNETPRRPETRAPTRVAQAQAYRLETHPSKNHLTCRGGGFPREDWTWDGDGEEASEEYDRRQRGQARAGQGMVEVLEPHRSCVFTKSLESCRMFLFG